MKEKKTHLTGYIFALLATAIWSMNFIIARGLSSSITPVSLAFFRWSIAALFSVLLAGRSVWQSRAIIKRNLPYMILVSILGVSLFNTLIYIAGRTTTAINLSMISITFPIYIMILSRFIFHEKITKRKILGMVIVFSGSVFLITKGDIEVLRSLSFSAGDLWMLLAAITFAVYSILLKFKPKDLEFLTFQTATFIIGLIILVPFFIADRLGNPPITWSAEIFVSLGYVGIFASLIAFLIWNKAIHSIGAVKTSLIYYTLPLFSAADAMLILGEEIHSYHLISLVVIISGILIASLSRRQTSISR